MLRPVHGLVLLLPLLAQNPARASCFGAGFSQVSFGNYHYVLLPAGPEGTDDSLVGRFWQLGTPALNQGNCDETNWLHRCGTDCTIVSDGPAFYVDGDLQNMPCSPACPQGEMVLLLEDRAPYGEFVVARVDDPPVRQFDFSLSFAKSPSAPRNDKTEAARRRARALIVSGAGSE